jgi:hypothetical protein
MTKAVTVLLGTFALFVFSALLLSFGYVGFSNDANKFEVDIKAKYTDNKNVYDNGWKKVVEVSQVPALQVDALKQLYDATMKGRYGAEGSRAFLQFIKEQNPNLDQTTFIKIQQDIESFRSEFQANQTALVARKQSYETFLTATTSGRFYNMIGSYPHIDLTKFDIVTSERTENVFDSKRDEPLKLK